MIKGSLFVSISSEITSRVTGSKTINVLPENNININALFSFRHIMPKAPIDAQ